MPNKIQISDTENDLNYLEEVQKANFALQEASMRIKELEQRLNAVDSRVPKTYPDVKFLNYVTRKRILVKFFFQLIKCKLTTDIYIDNWWCWICWISLSGLINAARA